MTCRELVELVTDYLEGRLPDTTRQELEEHLSACENCTAYIAQMRITLRALGSIPEETVTPAAREELIAAFRDLRSRTA
jgi:anti-sigma factor RsiW